MAIAAGIAKNAEVMVLDEPTSGLDYRNMIRVKALMEMMLAKGKTLIVITHDYEFLVSTCSTVIELRDGTIKDTYSILKNYTNKLKSFFEIE